MNLSNIFLRLGAVIILCGVSLGWWMGMSGHHELGGLHVHVNLLGGVWMFLYGLFYRAEPAAARGWLPTLHAWVAVIGFLIFMPSIAVLLLAYAPLMSLLGPAMGISTSLVVLGMALFALIVFKATAAKDAAA